MNYFARITKAVLAVVIPLDAVYLISALNGTSTWRESGVLALASTLPAVAAWAAGSPEPKKEVLP